MNDETYQGKMPLTALSPTEHTRQYLIRRESLKNPLLQIHKKPFPFSAMNHCKCFTKDFDTTLTKKMI